jgi:MscS family membrane protein
MRNHFARFLFITAATVALLAGTPRLVADDAGASEVNPARTNPAPAATGQQTVANTQATINTQTATSTQAATNTQPVAIVTMGLEPDIPDFVTHMGDRLLELFHIQTTGNSWERYLLAVGILLLFYLFRRLALPLIFKLIHRAMKRVTLEPADRIISAVGPPTALFIMITGLCVALRTLHHPPDLGRHIHQGARILWAVAFLWMVVRVIGAIFDHMQGVAKKRDLSIAAFMPWIRKSVVTIIVIFSGLVILQQFGVNTQTFLAGLGLGGLAFALAAQDTVANVFGAAVVAVDQPFKIGDVVTLGDHTGAVEDIGIRSMKLRRGDTSLVVIPNKTVASESIINLSRFTNRRAEQVLGFTYDSTPAQLEDIVRDLRALITAEAGVMSESVQVYFRDFNASSLDLIIVYATRGPDYAKYMELRQRLNLAFMRAAQARGLSFAFPTQTLDLAPSAAKVFGKP